MPAATAAHIEHRIVPLAQREGSRCTVAIELPSGCAVCAAGLPNMALNRTHSDALVLHLGTGALEPAGQARNGSALSPAIGDFIHGSWSSAE